METRSGAVLRNARFGIIKTVITYILQFVLRTVIIYTLGVEYVGLNGLFSNILGCLSLAELGFGTAIVVSMYKPVAENDEETVKSLLRLYKKVYAIISVIVFVLGLAITPFLSFLIKTGVPENTNIYVVYLLLLLNTCVSYFAANKRSLLFVYQRNDIENKIKTICTIVLYSLQIAVLLLFKDFYVYMSLLPIITMLEGVIISLVAHKKFPFIKGKAEKIGAETKKEVLSNIKALSWHQLGGVLVLCTDNIIISSMLGGLNELGIYSNYTMITTCILAIITILTNSFQASIGNMLASEPVETAYIKFRQINFIFSFIVGFCTICLYVLAQEFIVIWLNSSDCLLANRTLLLICISFFLGNSVITPNMYNIALGLVRHNIWKPFIQGIINLAVSILLANYIGLSGVILGTIASYILMPVWVEPFTLFKYYFKSGGKQYIYKTFYSYFAVIVSGFITYYTCSLLPSGNLGLLVLRFIVCGVICLLTLLLLFAVMPEFKQCVAWGKEIIANMKSRKLNKAEVTAVSNVGKEPCDNFDVMEVENNDEVATIEGTFDAVDDKKLNTQELSPSENFGEKFNAKNTKDDEGKGN